MINKGVIFSSQAASSSFPMSKSKEGWCLIPYSFSRNSNQYHFITTLLCNHTLQCRAFTLAILLVIAVLSPLPERNQLMNLLRAMNLQFLFLGCLMLLATGYSSRPPLPEFQTICGNVVIPFPFSTDSNTSLDESFFVFCNQSYDPAKPFLNLDNVEVLDISLDGIIKVASPVASDCYDESGSQIYSAISKFSLSRFLISSALNKFIAVGCDTHALVQGFSEEWKQMSAGCVSWCDSIDRVMNGTCSGIGCCKTSIPKGVKDFRVDMRSFRNHTTVKTFNPCGFAFVVEEKVFDFSSSHLKDLQSRETVPVALEWSVGNKTCRESQRNVSINACRAEYSECIDSSNGIGYLCACLSGFQGNPYLDEGCQDIDECTTSKPCEGLCRNLPGSYLCSCPEGMEGDGKMNGSGCHPKSQKRGSTFFYIISGFMIPAVGTSWIFWRRKQKKLIKLRHNVFMRNGGSILETKYPRQKKLKVFTAEELKFATNNYDENNILHRDQYANITYYRGILSAGTEINHLITIKTCKAPAAAEVEAFINMLVTRSHFHQRNIVRLISCCLETQNPLLVYEYISMDTLYDYIHDSSRAVSLSWDIRLRIAAESARALAYLHSDAATVPIIHGNINSSCILLDDNYKVKVHDFALNCCSDCSQDHVHVDLAGYLDPESGPFGALTVKSDVYSFGVVLAELLTGEEVVSGERPAGERHLAQYFASSPRGNDLIRILDHRLPIDGNVVEELSEVAELLERCLSNSTLERPTMLEVAMGLEAVISSSSTSTVVSPNISLETAVRRLVRRNRSF